MEVKWCRNWNWRNSSPIKSPSLRSTRHLTTCFKGKASVASFVWMVWANLRCCKQLHTWTIGVCECRSCQAKWRCGMKYMGVLCDNFLLVFKYPLPLVSALCIFCKNFLYCIESLLLVGLLSCFLKCGASFPLILFEFY